MRDKDEEESVFKKNKIYLYFILVSVLPLVVVSFIAESIGNQELHSSVAMQRAQIITAKAEAISILVRERIGETRRLASSAHVVEEVRRANKLYTGWDDTKIKEYIDRIDKEWIDKEGDTDAARSIQNKTISQHFAHYVGRDSSRYGEIILTDRLGATVGMSTVLSDFNQGDEYWWQEAPQTEEHPPLLDDRGYDVTTKSIVMGVIAPVLDNGEFIGMLKISFNVNDIFLILTSVSVTENERIALVRDNGTTIGDSDNTPGISVLGDHQENDENVVVSRANIPFVFLVRYKGADRSETVKGGRWGLITWHVISKLDRDIAYREVDRLKQFSRWLILPTLLFALLLAFLLTKSLSRPPHE